MSTAETITLDPEFEELLRDIAADPESSLLRIPRPKRFRSFFDGGAPVGVLEPGLTRAEKHLLTVHRNELAWLLRQACLVKLVEGPRSRLYVSRYITPDRQVELIGPRVMKERLGQEREGADSLEDGDTALGLLGECVQDPTGESPSVSALAAASFRLQNTDEARVFGAHEPSNSSDPSAALQLLGDVLGRHPSESITVSALSYIGFINSRLLDFTRAQSAYSTICTLNESVLIGWMGRLLMSLQLGDALDVRTSAEGLERISAGNPGPVSQWAWCLGERRKAREWLPTTQALTLCQALRSSLGPSARRLADAIA